LPGYQEVLAAYERERPLYVELVGHTVVALQRAINTAGLHTLPVTGRTKESRSFAIKACVGCRYDRPLEQITDKAGVRVTVVYQRDLHTIVEIVKRTFTVLSIERKLDALDYDRNGYLGTHIQARLTAEQIAATRTELDGLQFEVQVRTRSPKARGQKCLTPSSTGRLPTCLSSSSDASTV